MYGYCIDTVWIMYEECMRTWSNLLIRCSAMPFMVQSFRIPLSGLETNKMALRDEKSPAACKRNRKYREYTNPRAYNFSKVATT